ncbi:MAG: periplasmic heavy metal sensor [Candidatus Binatia bacterium]
MTAKPKFAFLISLIVNVFLVGVLLGELPHHFDERLSREERMEKAIEALPEPLRARFRGKIEDLRESSDLLREQIRKAREEALRILTAEPFDGAAYDRQVSKIHTLYGQRSQRMAKVIKEIAKDLPQEQRQALAEVLKRPSPASSK